MDAADRHLPQPATIEAYGKGGFRFGGLSHRGSLLCLPNGIWASNVTQAADIDMTALARVFAADMAIDHFLIGTGKDLVPLPASLGAAFRARHIVPEAMATGTAVRTWNILLAERRRIGALLIAVE